MNICTIALFYISSLLSIEGTLVQEGTASFYGKKFQGRLTSSGERFDMNKLTAAHATLPFKTKVQVTNLKNNKTVVVRINDRMHPRNTKVIDMSRAAATQLDMIRDGIGKVIIRELPAEPENVPVIDQPEPEIAISGAKNEHKN